MPVGNVIPPPSCTSVSSEDSQPLCLPEGFSQQEDRLGLVSSGNTRPLPLPLPLPLLLLRSVSLPIYSQTHGAVVLKITALCASVALHRSLHLTSSPVSPGHHVRSVQNLKVQCHAHLCLTVPSRCLTQVMTYFQKWNHSPNCRYCFWKEFRSIWSVSPR